MRQRDFLQLHMSGLSLASSCASSTLTFDLSRLLILTASSLHCSTLKALNRLIRLLFPSFDKNLEVALDRFECFFFLVSSLSYSSSPALFLSLRTFLPLFLMLTTFISGDDCSSFAAVSSININASTTKSTKITSVDTGMFAFFNRVVWWAACNWVWHLWDDWIRRMVSSLAVKRDLLVKSVINPAKGFFMLIVCMVIVTRFFFAKIIKALYRPDCSMLLVEVHCSTVMYWYWTLLTMKYYLR